MSVEIFGSNYSNQYDSLYREKDYEAECNTIESLFNKYCESSIQSVLDLGCGTGNHLIPLTKRGYHVTGVELSTEMLDIAKQKIGHEQVSDIANAPTLIHGDVRSFAVEKNFDAAIMMFAVLGYQLTNQDVMAALSNVTRHVRQGGLFVCDVWFGPAVLAIRPSDRVKILSSGDEKIIRAASGRLDVNQHLCEIKYQLWKIREKQVLSESEETHRNRYFFPQELSLFFEVAGLELCSMNAFDDLNKTPDETSWNILVVGKVK
jgi:SAM-dependent methyltransferase